MMTSSYDALRHFPIYSHIMTSSTKMLTSAEKNVISRFFRSDPIKDVLNLYHDKFGATGTKNRKMTAGGSNGPPPPCGASKKPAPCRVNPIEYNLKQPLQIYDGV